MGISEISNKTVTRKSFPSRIPKRRQEYLGVASITNAVGSFSTTVMASTELPWMFLGQRRFADVARPSHRLIVLRCRVCAVGAIGGAAGGGVVQPFDNRVETVFR